MRRGMEGLCLGYEGERQQRGNFNSPTYIPGKPRVTPAVRNAEGEHCDLVATDNSQ